MSSNMATIGIIGGSGLYALDGITEVEEIAVATPFGAPSDRLTVGKIGDCRVVFLPRHGRGHRLLPSEVPFRANVFAMKALGVEWLLSISAVGSMREHIHPGDIVLPHQFIDRTRREATFFGQGIVAHVGMAEPTCGELRAVLASVIRDTQLPLHEDGTYLCMEGPAFSTRAESHAYRSLGVSVIGMTAMPEAKLAREAELHYAVVALATDYDCWHDTEDHVSVDAVVAILQQNVANVRRVLERALPAIAHCRSRCQCEAALANAILTDPRHVPEARVRELGPLLRKYGDRFGA